VSNTLLFRWISTGNPTGVDWDALCQAVRDFYITTGSTPATSAIESHLGSQISLATNVHDVSIYQIDPTDPHHYFGSPVHTLPFSLTAAGTGGPFPQESCLALSFRAAYNTDPEHSGSTRPRASDRGRIYIGPLDAGAAMSVTTPAGTQLTVATPNTMNAWIGAAKKLWAAVQTLGFFWSVWSRKEQLFKNIVDWAVNNDLDSQRRRSSGQALQTWTPF
jgi:hypothetical protein